MELLVDLNQRDGTTIVAVLHDIGLAAHFFPRIVVLDRGPRSSPTARRARRSTPERIREVFGVDPALVRMRRARPGASAVRRARRARARPRCRAPPRRAARRRRRSSSGREPVRGIAAVAPNPTTLLCVASSRMAMTAVQTDSPPRSGIATESCSEALIASRSKAMYRPSHRSAMTRAHASSAARPATPASIPAPKCATGEAASIRDSCSSRTCPPMSAASSSRTVGPSAGLDEALVAAAAEHREGHAPDVARGRRGRRVEVAVGVEPGDREPRLRVAALEAGHRRRSATCSRRRGAGGARRASRRRPRRSPPRPASRAAAGTR